MAGSVSDDYENMAIRCHVWRKKTEKNEEKKMKKKNEEKNERESRKGESKYGSEVPDRIGTSDLPDIPTKMVCCWS